MARTIILRYYVSSLSSLASLEKGLRRITTAMVISEKQAYGFQFGLKLTANVAKMGPGVRAHLAAVLRSFPFGERCYLLYDPVDRGPGTSLQQTFANPSFFVQEQDRGILTALDLDQIRIDAEGLAKIYSLMCKMEEGDLLYGVGSRDVPVCLGKFLKNSQLREVHELTHSLAIGREQLLCDEACADASPAFAYCGESSGMSFVNTDHALFPDLLQRLSQATFTSSFRHWASEYYLVFVASQLGQIARGYIACYQNPYGGDYTEEWEQDHVLEFIKRETCALGKTDLFPVLVRALQDPRQVDVLEKFYPSDIIALTHTAMREGLSAAYFGTKE